MKNIHTWKYNYWIGVENIVAKGETAHAEQIPAFPTVMLNKGRNASAYERRINIVEKRDID